MFRIHLNQLYSKYRITNKMKLTLNKKSTMLKHYAICFLGIIYYLLIENESSLPFNSDSETIFNLYSFMYFFHKESQLRKMLKAWKKNKVVKQNIYSLEFLIDHYLLSVC